MSFGQMISIANCGLLLANLFFHFSRDKSTSMSGGSFQVPLRSTIRGLQLSSIDDDSRTLSDLIIHLEGRYESLDSRMNGFDQFKDVVSEQLGSIRNDIDTVNFPRNLQNLNRTALSLDDGNSKSGKNSKSRKEKLRTNGDPNLQCFAKNNTCYTTSKYIFENDVELEKGRSISADNIDSNLNCFSKNSTCTTTSKLLFKNDIELGRGRRIRADLAQIRVIENMLGKSVIATDKIGLRAFENYRLNVEKAQLQNITDSQGRQVMLAAEGELRVTSKMRVSSTKRMEVPVLGVGNIDGIDGGGMLRVTSNMRVTNNKRLVVEAIQFQNSDDPDDPAGTEVIELDPEDGGGLRVSSNMRVSNNKRLIVETLQLQKSDEPTDLNGTNIISADGDGMRVSSNMRVSNNKRLIVETLQLQKSDEPTDLNGSNVISADDNGMRVSSNMRLSSNKRLVVPTILTQEIDDLNGTKVMSTSDEGLEVTSDLRVTNNKRLVVTEATIQSLDIEVAFSNTAEEERDKRRRILSSFPGRRSLTSEGVNRTIETRQYAVDVNNFFRSFIATALPDTVGHYTLIEGLGQCTGKEDQPYDFVRFLGGSDVSKCADKCNIAGNYTTFVGMGWAPTSNGCYCYYSNNAALNCNEEDGCLEAEDGGWGEGRVESTDGTPGFYCYSFDPYPLQPPNPVGFETVGDGWCLDANYKYFSYVKFSPRSAIECAETCVSISNSNFVGMEVSDSYCLCDFEQGFLPEDGASYPGAGQIIRSSGKSQSTCYRYLDFVCYDIAGWKDTWGYTCPTYERNNWCPGPDLNAKYGFPSEGCCFCGGGTKDPDQECYDMPDWVGEDGSDCEDFENSCPTAEEEEEVGKPRLGCCSCGGGTAIQCYNVQGWTDTWGGDCSIYSNWCPGPDIDEDYGKPSEGCCICGGGSTTPPCYDDPGWVDTWGNGCEMYSNSDKCPSAEEDADYGSPSEACCACGGGSNDPPQCFDVVGWRDTWGGTCRVYEDNKWCPGPDVDANYGTPSEGCCFCGGGTTNPKQVCYDIPDWVDLSGHGCDMYTDYCPPIGDEPSIGKMSQGCCSCGGGTSAQCFNLPGWTDTWGKDCSIYSNWCPGPDIDEDYGKPSEGCCICGGGATSPPK